MNVVEMMTPLGYDTWENLSEPYVGACKGNVTTGLRT